MMVYAWLSAQTTDVFYADNDPEVENLQKDKVEIIQSNSETQQARDVNFLSRWSLQAREKSIILPKGLASNYQHIHHSSFCSTKKRVNGISSVEKEL